MRFRATIATPPEECVHPSLFSKCHIIVEDVGVVAAQIRFLQAHDTWLLCMQYLINILKIFEDASTVPLYYIFPSHYLQWRLEMCEYECL